ncbi:rod shape-determining protein MreC [Rhodoflexus sp.]
MARYRNFFLFLLLELLAFGLIVGNNAYQRAAFFSFISSIASSYNRTRESVRQYIYLQQRNEILAEENALLLKRLNQRSQTGESRCDSLYISGYDFIPARVIANSTALQNNYIMLDKGTNDGVAPGMGIIVANGVVGKIKTVTANASIAYSFLHNDLSVSVKIKRLGVLGTLRWGKSNITEADLLYVGQHEKVALGDTIVTAGFNAVYPPDLPIGIISGIRYGTSAISGNAFLDLQVRLNTNYAALSQVYIVGHKQAKEIEELKKKAAIPKAAQNSAL